MDFHHINTRALLGALKKTEPLPGLGFTCSFFDRLGLTLFGSDLLCRVFRLNGLGKCNHHPQRSVDIFGRLKEFGYIGIQTHSCILNESGAIRKTTLIHRLSARTGAPAELLLEGTAGKGLSSEGLALEAGAEAVSGTAFISPEPTVATGIFKTASLAAEVFAGTLFAPRRFVIKTIESHRKILIKTRRLHICANLTN